MKTRTILSFGAAIIILLLISASSVQAEWQEFDKVTAGDGAADDFFGTSVCVSGDYAIVGAYKDDVNGSESGSAYIFKKDGAAWTLQTKITATDGAAGDWFGWSVSISGDYVIVGAYGDDDRGSDSGSAYIFKRNGTAWSQLAKLTASDGAAYDLFGYSVSISGDYAIAGAYRDNSYRGSAYIFKRDGTAWTEQTKLTASDGAAYDLFGCSVGISGDYAIIGAYRDDTYRGSAYIFKRNGTTWSQLAKLTASDGTTYDLFGYSVGISGNYAIVGAYRDDTYRGSAYVFVWNGTNWVQQAKLTASDGAAYDVFGWSVGISGDYAIVGAEEDDDKGSSSGSAYVFKRDGTAWPQLVKLTASDGAASDYFGSSVSISDYFAIIGANGDESNLGSAYLFADCPYSDLTGNCFIDFEDLALLANDWLNCSSSNLTGDCFIDFEDFALLANDWLKGQK
ncbi:MAG: FG-GAP repeat protein [Phycisphaerae bacterium]|jgi:hypothetical protein